MRSVDAATIDCMEEEKPLITKTAVLMLARFTHQYFILCNREPKNR